MTFVNQTAPLAPAHGPAAMLRDWRAAYAKHRMFRRTLRELETLTARELADLGLSRGGLRAAAHEAVYG